MKTAFLKSYFSGRERARVWKKLSSMLRHRVSELDALTILHTRFAAKADPLSTALLGGHPLGVIFASVIREVNKGRTLDEALSPWVPHEEALLIRAGKQSGRLADSLIDCANLIEARQTIASAVISAISYPALLLCLFVALFVVVALYVVPELALLSNPLLWDGAAGALYAVSIFVASPAGAISLVTAALAVFAALLSLPYWTGPLRVRFDAVPPWSIYRLMVGSVWLFTVATLLRANNSLDYILKDMLASDILRPWLRERVRKMHLAYQQEANFGKLLLGLNMNFPDREMVEDLAVYASMPDFHKQMYAIAREWLDEGILRIAAQAKLVNGALLILILTVLCGVGVAIGSIQSQLANSMGA
jgi:type II secretory pathway component PulF